VKELYAPAAVHVGCHSNPGRSRFITEDPVSQIAIDRKLLPVEIANEKIRASVVIVIGRVHSHSRPCGAVRVVGDLCRNPDFVEAALSTVPEQKVRHRIVGHEEVEPAIKIDIGSDCAEGLSQVLADARCGAHVLEAISVIVKQPAGPGLVSYRIAVVTGSRLKTFLFQILVVPDEMPHVEGKLAVSILAEA